MTTTVSTEIPSDFNAYVAKQNKKQLIFWLPLLALLVLLLGIFMPLWQERSFLFTDDDVRSFFHFYMVYILPIVFLLARFIIIKLPANNTSNLLCLFMISNLLVVQHAGMITLSITLSPLSVILVTAMAKMMVLRVREIITIWGSGLIIGFIMVDFLQDAPIMSIHLYISISIMLIWVLYLGNDHFTTKLQTFIYDKEQWKAKKQITLQVMELEAQKKQLQQLIGKDSLTGIFNRGYFDQHLRIEIKRTTRSSAPLGLLVVDIDYFKMVNDQLGHHTGDLYLTKVAKALEKIAKRPTDIVARYGGEEFVLLLPDTDRKGLEVLSKQILDKINELNIPHPIQSHLTVSIGGCEFDSHTMDRVSFFERADQALYRVKSGGRNNVFIAS
ncbi:GGDEF domain-containing protein [Vibrio comitans]